MNQKQNEELLEALLPFPTPNELLVLIDGSVKDCEYKFRGEILRKYGNKRCVIASARINPNFHGVCIYFIIKTKRKVLSYCGFVCDNNAIVTCSPSFFSLKNTIIYNQKEFNKLKELAK